VKINNVQLFACMCRRCCSCCCCSCCVAVLIVFPVSLSLSLPFSSSSSSCLARWVNPVPGAHVGWLVGGGRFSLSLGLSDSLSMIPKTPNSAASFARFFFSLLALVLLPPRRPPSHSSCCFSYLLFCLWSFFVCAFRFLLFSHCCCCCCARQPFSSCSCHTMALILTLTHTPPNVKILKH